MELMTREKRSAPSDREGRTSHGEQTPAETMRDEKVAYRWELTRREFVQAIADNHPDVDDPEGFFDRYGGEIVHRFSRRFDALVGDCGATYETVMREAIEESVDEHGSSAPVCSDAREVFRPRGCGRTAPVRDSPSLPGCSHSCKEVEETMDTETQHRLDDYVTLFAVISERVNNDAVAIAILQEMCKDRRSTEIHEEREVKNDRPATEKQKQYMKKLNIPVPENLTKRQASMLIDGELGKNGE